MRTIEVQEVLHALPHFETFCSVEKLHGLVERLQTNRRFVIEVAGAGAGGVPIHHVRCGTGSVKALVVGGPHAHEPIGSLTVFGLLSLLDQGHRALLEADVEWHIIPCIDPDGAILNEGWTQQPFTVENYVRNFYLQPRSGQVDFSFPISYKKLVFDKPSNEAGILRRVLDTVRPDLFFSLHNCAAMGGTWFFMSRDIGQRYYRQITGLMAQQRITLQTKTALGVNQFAEAMRELPTTRDYYDYLERERVAIPEEYLQGKRGVSSQEYLLEIKPDALVFGSELTYGQHPCEASETPTGQHLRQLNLRIFADNKFLAAAILEEWDKVKDDVDATSPFYCKIAEEMIAGKARLHEGVTEWYERPIQYLLFNPSVSGVATESDRIQAYVFKTYFLGNAYAFVRLLKASKQTVAVRQAIGRLEHIFDQAIDDMKQHVDFTAFEVTDCGRLAKAQLGSGLIALNSVLEMRGAGV